MKQLSIERISKFLGLWVMVDPESADYFQHLENSDREQVLSELNWRITCIVQGSMTAVMGVASYDVGHGFRANLMVENGQDVFILVGSGKS